MSGSLRLRYIGTHKWLDIKYLPHLYCIRFSWAGNAEYVLFLIWKFFPELLKSWVKSYYYSPLMVVKGLGGNKANDMNGHKTFNELLVHSSTYKVQTISYVQYSEILKYRMQYEISHIQYINEQTCSLQITDSVYYMCSSFQFHPSSIQVPSKFHHSSICKICIQIGLLDSLNNSGQSQSVTDDRFPKNWRRSVNSSSQLMNIQFTDSLPIMIIHWHQENCCRLTLHHHYHLDSSWSYNSTSI